MSIKVMSMIWEIKFPCVQAKMIALKMADCGNDEGTQIFPSVASVQLATGCSKSTVKKYLKQFDDIGLLRITEREAGGYKTYGSRRQFNMDMLRSLHAGELELVFVKGDVKDRVLQVCHISMRAPGDPVVCRTRPAEVAQGGGGMGRGGRPTTPNRKGTVIDPPLSSARGDFQSEFDCLSTDENRERIVRLFLRPVADEVRIEHSNPQTMFSRVIDACSSLSDDVLIAGANQVAITRKKVISPKCLIDCINAAEREFPKHAANPTTSKTTITKEGNPQNWAAWLKFAEAHRREQKYYALHRIMLMSNQVDVESEWPPTKSQIEY
ncbi:MAG: hypothetical protein AAF709_00560 [Pseudomonadota bacterium]